MAATSGLTNFGVDLALVAAWEAQNRGSRGKRGPLPRAQLITVALVFRLGPLFRLITVKG